MANKRKRGDTWHYTVKNAKALPRPIYLSFDDELAGDEYVRNLELLLDRGIVPPGLLDPVSRIESITDAITEYQSVVPVADADRPILELLKSAKGGVSLRALNYDWAESWVSGMKREQGLSPSTIRHRVGCLARCIDWCVKKGFVPANPLRSLARGYATYTDEDVRAAEAIGLEGKEDDERDRRLDADEETRIRAALAGEKRDDRQRALLLPERAAMVVLFDLALESAMRLREMYTLEPSQIDLKRATINLDRTKNGDRRQVPMSSVAVRLMTDYLKTVKGKPLVFPWWNGERSSLNSTTSRLSRQWARVFAYANVEGFRFHDLRHEATCRIYERTTLTDVQIARITGHKDPRMLRRYASLRGSDLAVKLW